MSCIILLLILPFIASVSCGYNTEIRQGLYDYIAGTAAETLAELEQGYSRYQEISGQSDHYENQAASLKSAITDLSGCYTYNTWTTDLQKCTIRLTIVSQSSISSHWLLRMQRGAVITETDIFRMQTAISDLPQVEWNVKYARLCGQRLPKIAERIGTVKKFMALFEGINYRDWRIEKRQENMIVISGNGLGTYAGDLTSGEWHYFADKSEVFEPSNAQAEALLSSLNQEYESVEDIKKYIGTPDDKAALPEAGNDTCYSETEWWMGSDEVNSLWESYPQLKSYMQAISNLGYQVSCRGTVSKLGWGINRDTMDEEIVVQVLLK